MALAYFAGGRHHALAPLPPAHHELRCPIRQQTSDGPHVRRRGGGVLGSGLLVARDSPDVRDARNAYGVR